MNDQDLAVSEQDSPDWVSRMSRPFRPDEDPENPSTWVPKGRNPAEVRTMQSMAWKLLFNEGYSDMFGRVITYIKAGTYMHVAMLSVGILESTQQGMRQRASEDDPKHMVGNVNPYARFYEHLRIASAESRALAEVEVRNNDPKFWLQHGPAKTDPLGNWTDDRSIEVNHHVEGQIEHEHDHDVSVEMLDGHMGAVLQELQNLGIAQPTDRGKGMIDGTVNDTGSSSKD